MNRIYYMSVMQNTHGSEVFLSEEMKRFEKSNFLKKSSYSFMKKAGYEVFKFIKDNFKKKQSLIVLCGPGNNGGDGFVIARHLINRGCNIHVYTLTDTNNYKGDARRALKDFKGITKKIRFFKLTRNSLIVDCLFGIGLKRNIKGKLEKIFKLINKSNNFVVSADIPSGISSNDGQILGIAIKADFTVTFHRKKMGHILGHGKEYSGKLKVADIGFNNKKMKTRF